MPNRRVAILLALFFGGLIGFWAVRRVGLPTAEERRRQAALVLPDLAEAGREAVVALEVEGPDGSVRLERQGPNRWSLVGEANTRADAERVETLLANLERLRKAPDAGELTGDPSDYGLETPSAVLRLFRAEDGGAAEAEAEPWIELAVGDRLEDWRYVRPGSSESGPIRLAEAARLAPLETDPNAWRERDLFQTRSYDISRVEVDGPSRALTLELEDGRWAIVRPFRAPANAQAVSGLLADLASLRAIEGGDGFAADDVTTENLGDYGLDPPHVRITLHPSGLTGSEPETVLIGGSAAEDETIRFAARESENDVLRIRSRVVGDLGRDPLVWRSRRVIDLPAERLAAVRITTQDRDHRLVRRDGEWRVEAPIPGPADPVETGQLLSTLGNLQTADFLKPEEVEDAGLDEPRAVFEVWTTPEDAQSALEPEAKEASGASDLFDEPPAASVAIGRYDPATQIVYGRLEGDSVILSLPKTIRDAVPENPLAFRDRTLLRIDPLAIRQIDLRRNGRHFVVERPQGERDWQFPEPLKGRLDPTAVQRLADSLAMLRAERLIAEEPESLEPFGLEEPEIEVSWRADSPAPVNWTLQVGAPVSGHPDERYARLDGRALVFTIGPRRLEALRAELRDRRLLRFDVEWLERIALESRNGDRVAFVREPSEVDADAEDTDTEAAPPRWEPEDGADWPEGFDASALRGLAAGLANLTAVRFVQDKGPMPEELGLDPPAWIVRANLADQPEPITLRLGERTGDLRPAALEAKGPGAVFLIRAEPLRLPETLREPEAAASDNNAEPSSP